MNKLYLTSLKLAALAVAGLLLGSSAARAQTPPSPVGDWDLVFSGSQKGLAVLTFNAGNTLSGYEVIRPGASKSSSSVELDPRWGLVEPGRRITVTTGGGGSGAPKVITNLLGSAPLGGRWQHDVSGKVIGIIDQIVQSVKEVETYETNIFNGDIVTNLVQVFTSETNAISFRAVVVPGTRITINTYGPDGNNVLRGTPASIAPGLLSGDFYAIGKRDTLNFVEFLNLVNDPMIASRYDADGIGPGYDFTGRILVSNKKQIAIATLSLSGVPTLSVYTGSFNLTTHRGKLTGVDSSDRRLNYNFNRLP